MVRRLILSVSVLTRLLIAMCVCSVLAVWVSRVPSLGRTLRVVDRARAVLWALSTGKLSRLKRRIGYTFPVGVV